MRSRTRVPGITLLSALAIALGGCGSSASSPSPPAAEWSVFAPGPRVAIARPDQLAVAPNGRVYVLNGQANTVQVVSAAGKLLSRWGPSPGFVSGDNSYNAIAAGPNGTVYIASDPNVLVYAPSGQLKTRWRLGSVESVAVARAGTVYVSRSTKSNSEILELTPGGTITKAIPTPAREKVSGGTFPCPGGDCTADVSGPIPAGLAVAPDGTIYDAVDYFVNAGKSSNDYAFLQKRSASGTLLAETPLDGSGLDLAVAVDGTAVGGSEAPLELLRFDATLKSRAFAISTASCGPTSFDGIGGVATDAQGNVYVGDTADDNIHKLSPSGRPLALWGGCPNQSVAKPEGVALGGSGNVYVASSDRGRVVQLSSTGQEIGGWNVTNGIEDLKVDTSGNVYVADNEGPLRILEYSPDGRLIHAYPMSSQGSDCPCENSLYIALSRGAVYAYNQVTHTLYELAPQARVVVDLAGKDSYSSPEIHGIAVDGAGNFYLANRYPEQILKLSPSGAKLAAWPASDPWGLVLDRGGNIWVTNYGPGTVEKYSPAGKQLAKWGSDGSGLGQLSNPEGIAVDAHGNVYVADSLNNRVEKLSTEK